MPRIYDPDSPGNPSQYRAIEFDSGFVATKAGVTVYLSMADWCDLAASIEAEEAWESGDHATEYTKGAAA